MLKIVPDTNSPAKPVVSYPLAAAFRAEVDARVGAGDFASREEAALALANEVVRADLTAALERQVAEHGTGDVLIDGELYRFHVQGSKTYASLVGPLPVERPTFRKVGARNGPTVVALDRAAGLMHDTTPALAARIARGKAKDPSRDLYDDLVASHRVPPSRSTLEKKGNAIGAALHWRKTVVEAAARRSETLPEGARTLVLGLDRTSSPMEEDLPADTPPRPRKKPRVRKAPPPVEVNYRMAFVGTMASADADGDVLSTYRYGATAADGPGAILHAMMQDIRHALRQEPSLRIVVVQDAAKEMWTHVVAALEAEPSVSHWEELVDHYHAMGHLWAAAEAMEGDTKTIITDWKAALRHDDDAIDAIKRTLEREISRGYFPKYRIAMEDELTFITNNSVRMRYASLRDAGFPIGSGVTEGACKSFFSIRCKRSGQRWRNPGLRATLACRTLLLNGRLDRAIVTLRRRDYSSHVQAVPSLAA
ncbi:MAG: hypothetical protein GW913_15040 [Myxococcales bacterium]|nr:hypothetical protein [Myxococcales bacterium]